MECTFSLGAQLLLALGKVRHMQDATGKLLPILVHTDTGKIFENARIVGQFSLQPILAPLQLLLGGAQMYQNHRGFQAVLKGLDAIKSSLGVLQATTAVIGVGTAATVGLSAVNLHQTLKLRKELKNLGLEVKDGFIDLKTALRDQGAEVIAQIDDVAQDIIFEQHRLELIKAYGHFLEATRLIKITSSCGDSSIQNADLANARQTLSEALSI